ncbi:MAG: PEGA domain protein [Bacteroidetes bacterium ADurb.BinA012]|nr:MAG: PEGA domain protein [Bacteroidetes bacterium ADurb.BinA012]
MAVEHGKTQRVKAKLKLASAQVNISTSHDDVIVSVDGTELGTPPLQTTLSSGTHTLSVDGEFVFPFKEKFIVGSESLELELQLEEAAVVEGAVSPQDAKIMWNGQQLSGPSFKRKEKPGDYKLAVEHKDFPPMEMPVKLRSGKKTTLTIDLSRKDASVVSNGFLRDDRYDAWFGTSIAVTGVAVAVGVASLGMYWSIRPEADSAYDRYRASAFRDPDLARDFRDLSGQLNTWEIVGWSMLGVGLVAGTSAFLAWYFGRQEGVQGKKGTVTLYPVLDRNGLGLGAAMVF